MSKFNEKMDGLLKLLDEKMNGRLKLLNEKMDGLLNLLRGQRGSRHPIEGHPLTDVEHLAKNRYLSHLCAILLYRNSVNGAQRLFMDRLTAGALAEHGAEDYMRMALDITAESMAELIDGLKNDQPLAYSFALDALLLCHMQNCGEAQAAFLAEIFDALGITEPDMKFLLCFAKAGLTMDADAFNEAKQLLPEDNIPSEAFMHYVRLAEDALDDMEHWYF